MVKCACSNFIFFGAFRVERKYFNAFVDGVAVDSFHIVIFGLAHIDTVKVIKRAKNRDIMVATSAEVNCATAEFVKQFFEKFLNLFFKAA
jgi:pantoate kinase